MPHKNNKRIFDVLVGNAMDQLELGLNIDADNAIIWANKYIRELEKDKNRLDWLANTTQTTGSVMLPKICVEQNLDSMRGAIDDAIEMDLDNG